MAKLTPDQARQLSQFFHDLSTALGDFRFGHWDDLTPAQRAQLESAQWSLLNASSDMTTLAVQITLEDSQDAFNKLQDATAKAQRALQRLDEIRKVLNVAASLVTLAAAIISKEPSAIFKAAKGVVDAAKDN